MKIIVTGLTSTALGGMEYQNLGNYIIVDPFFAQLRAEFPVAEIVTTIQMSDSFYEKYSLRPLKDERFWKYGFRTATETLKDIARISLFKVFRSGIFLNGKLLGEFKDADIVIDFSGDIYGDNARWHKFLEGNARLVFALMMNKPVAMLIGSPGPFQSFWRQWLAKKILPKLDLVTNREPLSTAMLAYIGISGDHIVSTACPSVLFEKTPLPENANEKDIEKVVESDRPVAGFILCGWNMPVGPFNAWPREDWEFQPFIEAIDYLVGNTEHRICLMAHQNAVSSDGVLIPGNDHRLIRRLVELLGDRVDGDRIYSLKGLYDAGQSKTIISNFDFLVSGRIHGAVQGMSQGIPTVIMDYGHEPKPHKLAGFARVYGADEYVVSPTRSDAIIRALDNLLFEKERIGHDLKKRLPNIKEKARANFDMLTELTS